MSTWHYMQNGVQAGPATTEELTSLLAARTLPATTLVWRDGMPGWVAANTLGEFSGVVPAAPPAPPPAPPALGGPGVFVPDPADVEKNKVFGILAYLGILFLVPLLAAKDSPFARYHTNQGVVLFITAICSWIGIWIVDFILVFIPILGWILIILLNLALFISILAAVITGIINAARGVCKPLPIIGHRFTLIK